ncbi:MAG TPA: hypothetical protein VK563_09625 [Puia sp.]|nr:hypothetical protein [Puia sp.]
MLKGLRYGMQVRGQTMASIHSLTLKQSISWLEVMIIRGKGRSAGWRS